MGKTGLLYKGQGEKEEECNHVVRNKLTIWENVEYARAVPAGRELDIGSQNILGTIWGLAVLLQQPEYTAAS